MTGCFALLLVLAPLVALAVRDVLMVHRHPEVAPASERMATGTPMDLASPSNVR